MVIFGFWYGILWCIIIDHVALDWDIATQNEINERVQLTFQNITNASPQNINSYKAIHIFGKRWNFHAFHAMPNEDESEKLEKFNAFFGVWCRGILVQKLKAFPWENWWFGMWFTGYFLRDMFIFQVVFVGSQKSCGAAKKGRKRSVSLSQYGIHETCINLPAFTYIYLHLPCKSTIHVVKKYQTRPKRSLWVKGRCLSLHQKGGKPINWSRNCLDALASKKIFGPKTNPRSFVGFWGV